MDKYISIKPLDSQIDSNTRLVKKSDYQHLLRYEELQQQAQEREQERNLIARDAIQTAVKKGFDQGLEQANQQLTEQIMAHTIAMHKNLEQVETALAEIVIQAVQKIISDFDDETLIRHTVRNGIDLVRGSKKLQIRINPQMQDAVTEQLQEIRRSIGHVEIIGDTQLKLDECILESDVGIVHASVELQIAAMVRALREGF